ncbi:hypothetical protein NDN08_003947 [Rhodosorus marinus]|uniref:CP-type G domain-containing protein n=1 Tax=Rhodosorus marinus TaxID=101924 RepID=A0AAV8UJV5_9RHOD|nr:hypothetical protein NDN08_003947 [Rhodosorus marinus]
MAKKQSKRTPARQKYKVAKKVRAHHKKLRKEERSKKKGKEPLTIPNSYPYKHELMEEIEQQKRDEEEKKREQRAKRKEERKKTKLDSLGALSDDARRRESKFNDEAAEVEDGEVSDKGILNESSRKAYIREFRKVVDASDIVLQVLDARDPLGCRCHQAERMIMEAGGGSKRIVLILNKVDLVPKDVTQKWLSYLRNDYPTVAFRATTQSQKNVSQAKSSAVNANEIHTSNALGADALMQLLKNYTRNRGMKTACTVGIIGYPNVGKSSLINSLKRSRAVTVGATPGVTKGLQEVHLDKHIRLIDSPGIVFATGKTNALVLRNCIKVENLEDPIGPVEFILERCGHEVLMAAYAIPTFDGVTECLALVAKKRGKVRKSGSFDLAAAARIVLQDWNGGKIGFYTIPPSARRKSIHRTKLVAAWGKEFDLKKVVSSEAIEMETKASATESDRVYAKATATETDGMLDEDPFADTVTEEAENDEEMEVEDEDSASDGDEKDDLPEYKTVDPKTKKNRDGADKGWEQKGSAINPQVNKDLKKKQKALKKKRKNAGQVAMAVDAGAEDAYDFSVLDDENMAL